MVARASFCATKLREMTPGRAEPVPSKIATYDYFTKVPRLRPRQLLPPLETLGNKIIDWRIIKVLKKNRHILKLDI